MEQKDLIIMGNYLLGGGKMTTIFDHLSWSPGVMVKWSKIFDHDHGQNFKIAVVKWSKLAIFDHGHGQNLRITVVNWSNGQNWSILTIDHGQIEGFIVMVNFFDH